jgi:hypothetical protein
MWARSPAAPGVALAVEADHRTQDGGKHPAHRDVGRRQHREHGNVRHDEVYRYAETPA